MITDTEIRSACRRRPELLDMLMVAIHSRDRELRHLARSFFRNVTHGRK